ncbi:hypothetical protein ACLOJK_034395 [Asimina triloba]
MTDLWFRLPVAGPAVWEGGSPGPVDPQFGAIQTRALIFLGFETWFLALFFSSSEDALLDQVIEWADPVPDAPTSLFMTEGTLAVDVGSFRGRGPAIAPETSTPVVDQRASRGTSVSGASPLGFKKRGEPPALSSPA